MLEQLKFMNHINEELVFGKGGVFVNYNDLHDYRWQYTADGDKISVFKRGIVTKNVPVVVVCPNADQGVNMINNLMEYSEKDILVKEPGKLIIGDYYLKCYLTGSTKSDYLAKRGYMVATLEVLTDTPAWIKETKFSFNNSTTGNGMLRGARSRVESQNLDYNYDYPIDYTNPFASRNVVNPGFTGSDFKMIIYGPIEDPKVIVGEHIYEVDCLVDYHEYLTIDSKKKTIILTRQNGATENKFRYRNRESYIFEKIPSGETLVSWDGDYKFDIILYEERSEPKWI